MHDLIFAVAFMAMLAAPAMVATLGGKKEHNPEGESHSGMWREPGPAVPMVDPYSAQYRPHPVRTLASPGESTLPMLTGRGMSDR